MPENYHEDEMKVLFDSLAPFIPAGSYIEWQGEDGDFWRWEFNGKDGFVEQEARIVWE